MGTPISILAVNMSHYVPDGDTIFISKANMTIFFQRETLSRFSMAISYTHVLEKIVLKKYNQCVVHKTCRNLRLNGELSPNTD